MNSQPLYRKTEKREFFAHHMLLHAASLSISEAEATQVGHFNKCLAAMTMTALAVEGLVNAVGSRVAIDWIEFEKLRPHEKIDALVSQLAIDLNANVNLWTTLRFLGKFRNQIAHPKPELIVKDSHLPESALNNTNFSTPQSKLEREITVGNARRVHDAVEQLKGVFTDAMPVDKRFGIYADMWSGSTSLKHDA